MKKIIILLPLLLIAIISNAQFGSENDISKSTARAWNAKFYDLDGDGLLDILVASPWDYKVSWYKNIGGGNYGEQRIITSKALNVKLVDACDIDNDGDLDIISASEGDTLVSIYRNNGNGNYGQKEDIITTIVMPKDMKWADIDNDSYKDLILFSQTMSKVVWFKNNAGIIDTSQRLITNLFSEQIDVGDMDNDGDIDILCTATLSLRWIENLGGGVFNSTYNTIPNGSGFVAQLSDIDNDNDLDIITGSGSTTFYLLWMENLGNGNFGLPQLISNTIYAPAAVYTADIDGDNLKDVLCASNSSSVINKIAWYKNLGGGVISTTQHLITYNKTNDVHSLYAGDMDNDGDIDVLSASEADSKISVYENLGVGSFSPQKVVSSIVDEIESIATGDLDGDNDIDIISGSYSTVSWYENLGSGNIASPKLITKTLIGSVYVGVTDFDNDNDLDLLSVSTNKVAWYENNGSGVFGIEQIISNMSSGIPSGFVGDMDNDGYKDVVSALSPAVLVWYKNLGNGSFGTADTISTNGSSLDAIHGNDFDNDGDIDLVTAQSIVNKIESYENLGNGTFGPKTFISNASGPTCVYSKDINNDGNIDIVFGEGQGSNKVLWCIGNGNGGFSVAISLGANSIEVNDVYCEDLDGDLDNDVIYAADNKLGYYENLGNGVFNPSPQIIMTKKGSVSAIRTTAVKTLDVDMDGDFDIISGSFYDEKLSWIENFNISPYKLSGYVFYDQNQNKLIDSTEKGIPFFQLKLTPYNAYSYPSSNGYYIFSTDSGNHTVNYNTNSLWNLTTDSASYTRTLSTLLQIEDSLNFGVYPDSLLTIIEPDLTGSFPRCNSIANYWVNIQNQGTTLPSGVIHLQLHDSVSYVSAAVVPDSINGQNIYWHYDSLFFFSSEMINLQVQMPPFTSMGDTLTSYLTVHELDTFNNIVYTNVDTLEQVLVCAYDPNDKSVTPKGIGTEGFIPQNQELEYLIRFQNTGNDTAITVMVRDQLDANLDWSTLQPIASSDPVQIWIEQDGEAVFKFQNIMLPDSGADFLGSQGFVKFKIRPDTGLAPLTPIYNTGHIYFDNNPAVITNTVLNTIECYSAPLAVISYSFPYLNANVTGNYTYQWYLNGNLIAGANADTLLPLVDGNYTVEITDSNTCYKLSNPYNYVAVGIEELGKLKSVVYPNPFSESTTILFDKNLNGEYDLLVYDIVGKEVKHINKINGNKVEISKNEIGKGLFLAYVVNRTTGEKIFIEKLIVQ